MDDLDVKKLLKDLELGLVRKQPTHNIIDSFLELTDERVGTWRQVHVKVADLTGQCVAAVECLLWDWAVEED